MGSSRTGRTFDLASTIASRGRLFFLSDVPNRSEENHGGGIGKMRKRPGDCFVLSASLQHQKNTDDGVVVRAPLIRCPSSRRRQRLADNSSIRTDSIQSDTRVIDHGYEPWRCGEGRVPSGSNRVRKRAARPLVGAESMRKDMIIAGRRKRWKEVMSILRLWEETAERSDVKTYNIALSALSKSGRWREALATLDRMRSTGIPPDVYSFNSAISACGRGGMCQRALDLLAEMEYEGSGVRSDLISYNGAINAVAKAGRWEQALDLLARAKVRGLNPDVITYTSVMGACDRAGEWQRALDILETMIAHRIEPNVITYGTAISACARGGRWQAALSLLEEIPERGLVLNAHVYGSALHACVKGGQRKRALALLDEMLGNGVVPDAVVFTAAIGAVDGWAAALRLLTLMKNEGVMPDHMAYNAALSVIARSGREDVAIALLEQMRLNGCAPNVVSFNTAIDACATREKWQEAIQLLEIDMRAAKVKPDVITYTSVIHACAGPKGNWEKAYQVLDSMWQDSRGAKPNKITYDLVIQACGHGGQWELGVALLDDMRAIGIKPDLQTFNIAVSACGRSEERLAAEILVANMRRTGVVPDEFTYASLVAACGGAGDHTRAVEIFDEARYVHRVPPSLQIYGALLSALAKAEQWVDVLAYLDRMVADGIAPDAAATNAGVLAAAELGNGLRALSLLNGDRLQPRKWARDRRRTRDADKGSEDRHEGREERLRTGAAPWDEGQANGQREGASDGEGGHHARRSTSPKGGEIGISGKTEDREEGGEVEGGVMREGPEGTARLYKARAGGRGGWKAAKPALLISVLHALDSEGENVSVLEAVRRGREEGMLLNASIYRCAMKACGNLGDSSRASALLSEMVQGDVTPDIVHWNHALRASATGAQWRQAAILLRQMQASTVPPDAFSYSMALRACSTGLWSGDTWNAGVGWGPLEDGISPPRVQHSRAILVGRRANEREEQGNGERQCRGKHALEILQEMGSAGYRPCTQAFTLAMAACLEGHRDDVPAGVGLETPSEADVQRSEAVLNLFDRLEVAGEVPTASTYAFALKACARTANSGRAYSLFFEMLDASARDTASCSSDADHRDVPEGTEAPPARPLQVRPWHLASAIAAYDAAGDWAGAQRLWEEALRMGVTPRSPGYGAAIVAAVRAGDLTEASRLAEEAIGSGLELRPSTATARSVVGEIESRSSRGYRV